MIDINLSKIVDIKTTHGGGHLYIRGIREDGTETNPIDWIQGESKEDSIKRLTEARNRNDVALRLGRLGI